MPDSPWDHNAECRYCDEQAGHAADCSWLIALEQQVGTQEEVIRNQLRNLGELRRQLDAATAELELTRQERDAAVKVVEVMAQESGRERARELCGKMQFLIDWADKQGLLEEHLFTFPDGDIWEAKR